MDMPVKALRAIREQLDELLSGFDDDAQAPTFPLTLPAPKLKKGERYVGTLISADGAKREHIVLLPGEFKGDWTACAEWAKSIGGELFDRCQGTLLFATMKDEFKEEWYWTREQHASGAGCAWCQYFGGGYQNYLHKDLELRARAVRKITIE